MESKKIPADVLAAKFSATQQEVKDHLAQYGIFPNENEEYNVEDFFQMLTSFSSFPLNNVKDWGNLAVAAALCGPDKAGDMVMRCIENALLRGNGVYLPGGRLESVLRPARKAYNRLAETHVQLPARSGIRFKPSVGRTKRLFEQK